MKRLFFLLLLCASILPAQPLPEKKFFGASIGYIRPEGKFSEYDGGATLGLQYAVPFMDDRIQFRVDITGMTEYKSTYIHLGAFAEYHAYLSEQMYAYAGLGIMRQSLEIWNVKGSATGSAGVAGVGFDLLRSEKFILSPELRASLGLSGYDFSTFQLVIVGRFEL